MSFYTSLSGLQVAQTDMSTISHNLANVSTNGFKKSRSDFADVIASNFTTDPRRVIGSGAVLKQNVQNFSEGNLTTTGNSLDLALSGDGFFAVKTGANGGTLAYTRNGAFAIDPSHYVVDAQGSALQAYPVDASGNITATGSDGLISVKVPDVSGTPVATANVALGLNLGSMASAPVGAFDRTNPSTYNNAATTTVYDAAGTAMTMTNYFAKDATGDGWTMYSYVDDTALTVDGKAGVPVTFDASGDIATPDAATSFDAITPASSGVAQTIALDLAGSTAHAGPFSVASRTQDGASVGQFAGISIDKSGLIQASYSDGSTLNLGKVALANFSNPTGLRQTGNSYWSSTGVSGSAVLGSANQNGFGNLMSGTIEGSNVDITEELVGLIAAQRNFQANAKALDTASQISQTIFNIRA